MADNKDPPKNEIFQYSIVSALMDGVASDGLPVSTLLDHGDHGLGTFREMKGEMIILDKEIYQMNSDGSVVMVVDRAGTVKVTDYYAQITPFAMVTRFEPKDTDKIKGVVLPSKKALTGYLSYHLPDARNLYMAYRVDGTFRSVTVRTVGGQYYPGERLADVADRQVTKVLGYDEGKNGVESVKGTLFGFRSPDYTQGISVAGDHLHFIGKEQRRDKLLGVKVLGDKLLGGHVLDLETVGEVTVKVAPISKFHLELPPKPQFNRAQLKLDGAGIRKVEG